MKRLCIAIALLAAALACVLFAHAGPHAPVPRQQSSQQSEQQPPPQSTTAAPKPEQNQPPRINVTSALVVVPVTVKDSSGALVNNLLQEDFRLFDDNIEQKITVFSLDPSPISSVILLDNSLSIKNSEDVRKSLRAIVGGFAPGDETTVIRFDHYPEESSGFISDPDLLLTKLSHVELPGEFDAPAGQPILMAPMIDGAPAPGAPGITQKSIASPSLKCINDAVYAAAMLLRSRPKGRRRVIFLISDGEGSKHNTYNLNDTVRMLVSSEVAVYSIGVGGSFLDRGLNVISKLAHDSGGDVFYARGNMEPLYSRVEDQARNQYTIGYAPHHQDRVVSYHTLSVLVKRPGLTVYARQGYYSAQR
jgi:VWFA-related protein